MHCFRKWCSGTTLFAGILHLIPKKKIVSFSSLPDYSDNARAFYEFLIKLEDKGIFEGHRFVWHVNDVERFRTMFPTVQFVRLHSFKSVLLYLESDYVIKTHGFYEALGKDDRRKELLLFHGMPVKKTGYQNADDVKYGVLKADYYTVTSAFYKKVFENSFHADPEQIFVSGMPRNDVLFHVSDDVKSRIRQSFGENIILFLPTFRKCNIRATNDGVVSSDNESFGGNREAWEKLNQVLQQNNCKMIIKPHPMDAVTNIGIVDGLDSVFVINDDWLCKNDIQLYQLLGCSAKLITDYSSVYIDYLLLDRPICFFMPDFEGYKNTRGLVFDDPFEWMPGTVCYHFSELEAFVTEEDRYSAQRAKVNAVLNEIHDGSASVNVFDLLNTAVG